jgi:hypothetical protein
MMLNKQTPLLSFCKSAFLVAVFLSWITATVLFVPTLSAQTNPKNENGKTEKAKVEQPLELPEFVITGVESMEVPGGAKQAPKPPAKLKTSDLQRFNPLDKLSFALLPQAPLPTLQLPAQERSGFLRGEFGMFITPSIDAGYRAVLGNFDLTANVGGTLSNGHLPNADFSDVYGSLASSYLAPEKFLFFGGSRTDTYVRVRNRGYKFFANTDTVNILARNAFTLSGGVQTVGAFDGWVYDMGANAEYLSLATSLTTDTRPLENTILNGHLLGKKVVGEWSFGGKFAATMQSVMGSLTDAYLLAPMAIVEFRSANKSAEMRLSAGAHFFNEMQRNSPGTLTFRPAARIDAVLHVSSSLSLYLEGFTGVRLNSPLELVKESPYYTVFSSSALPDSPITPTKTLYNARLYARFQPTKEFGLTVGASSEMNEDALVFGGRFRRLGEIPVYRDSTTIHRLFAESAVFFDSSNTLIARFNANIGTSRRFGIVSYLPLTEAALEYRRYWLPALSTTLIGVYVGERWFTNGVNGGFPINNPPVLPDFVDIRLHIEYQFSPQFSIYARGTNLLNQPIFIWEGYRERGIFAALGVMLTF